MKRFHFFAAAFFFLFAAAYPLAAAPAAENAGTAVISVSERKSDSKGIPDGYYSSAYGKAGYELKTALYQIIKDPDVVSYDGLWTAFRSTDCTEDGKVWDIYADCSFSFGGSDQCGNYKQECDCYNREHSFPKSWFDDAKPMYSDLFHLYPTDGYVNNRRGNLPLGEVGSASYTSHSGCKMGSSADPTPGYSGNVFEPLDEYKGDLARSYFYMATCYENRIANWSSCPICNGTDDQSFDDWVVELLLQWHRQDPVSQKEIDRNNAVYAQQNNRNPFIDYPELVEKIWGDDTGVFDPENPDPEPGPDPEPVSDTAYRIKYRYADQAGNIVINDTYYIESSSAEIRKAQNEDLLIDEDFSQMTGSDRSGNAASVDQTDGYVESFSGKVFSVESGIRLGSSSATGTVRFKEIDVQDSLKVLVCGKGWSGSELDFKLSCSGCSQSEYNLKFTQSVDDLADGEYEMLAPLVVYAPGTAVLSIGNVSDSRVFIGSVSAQRVGSPENPDPEPDPDPEPAAVTILYPSDGDSVGSRTEPQTKVSARIQIDETVREAAGTYTLPEQELRWEDTYTLYVELYHCDSLIGQASSEFFLWGESVTANGRDKGNILSVYPNPNSGNFFVELPQRSTLEVFTNSGVLVRRCTDVSGKTEIRLLQPGMYYIRVSGGKKTFTGKVVVR